jgi:hypothetical protein
MSVLGRRSLALLALAAACAVPVQAERSTLSDVCLPALVDVRLQSPAEILPSTDALPLPWLVAETPIERAVRCAAERQACYDGCAVLPQVSLCRSNCDKGYRSCMGGGTGPSPL